MPFDRPQHGVGIATLHRHNASRIRELIKHRVEPPDVVIEQEGDGTAGVPANLEFTKHAHDVVDSRFALTGGAGGKQNQAWVGATT